MRGGITMLRLLSLAEPIHRMNPESKKEAYEEASVSDAEATNTINFATWAINRGLFDIKMLF